MWPWEHAAAGYLLYSLGRRALGIGPPRESDVAVLVFATVLPDLVDKPLSWGVGLFPTGYAIAHSVFVAIPVGIGVLEVGRRRRHRTLGVAFIVGYWSHLLGDVLTPIRTGGRPLPGRVLWPVVQADGYDVEYGIGRGLVYLREFVASIQSMEPLDVVLLYVLLPAITLGIWLADGAPGAAIPRRAGRELRRRF